MCTLCSTKQAHNGEIVSVRSYLLIPFRLKLLLRFKAKICRAYLISVCTGHCDSPLCTLFEQNFGKESSHKNFVRPKHKLTKVCSFYPEHCWYRMVRCLQRTAAHKVSTCRMVRCLQRTAAHKVSTCRMVRCSQRTAAHKVSICRMVRCLQRTAAHKVSTCCVKTRSDCVSSLLVLQWLLW
jgi:hypothetical protein